MTGNMRRRQATHAAGASHLAPLMHFALQQGYTILSRVKYLASFAWMLSTSMVPAVLPRPAAV